MSDALVRAHLEQLAAWLSDPEWMPDPTSMTTWNEGFTAALKRAERGPGWPALVAQGRVLDARTQERAASLAAAMADIRKELQEQGTANQALKAYQPTLG